MGGSCGTHSAEGKCIQCVGCKTSENDHVENLRIEGGDILKLILKKQCGKMDWIHLDQDRDRW